VENVTAMGTAHSEHTPVTTHSEMAPAPPHPAPTLRANNRGKDQIHWSGHVWQALDHAVMQEMRRTRVAAKFLPQVHVNRKQTTVAADVVIPPDPTRDLALSIDESQTVRVQEYWVQFRMTVAQAEAEEHEEAALAHHGEPVHHEGSVDSHHSMMHHPMMHHQSTHAHRASTGVSLALRTANILAQAEDLILFNGQNAVVNSPLFNPASPSVQSLDINLKDDIGLGLLNIDSSGNIKLPPAQVFQVKPTVPAGTGTPPRYAEATLDAVARGFTTLQSLGHYEHYALVLNTVPYADLHQALPTTLVEPVEPISHLIKAGIYGTGTLPPFAPGTTTGLPSVSNVAFTGVLVSLSGNTMDLVRGRMEDHTDAMVTFQQRDVNESYRFRVMQRFALRLKDPTAVILLLFMNS
jgi:Encapsulating protein for peroxidase